MRCSRSRTSTSSRLALSVLAALLLAGGGGGGSEAAPAGPPGLATVLHERGALALVDPARGVVARVPVGASPWGVAISGGRAYVSTARTITVVDVGQRRVIARVRLRTQPGQIERGEYRGGGMGIVASPDGRRVYVGVHDAGGGRGALEVLDTQRLEIVGSARIGVRPFDVLVSRNGREVYTVDHDSYGVTVLDAASLRSRFYRVAPLGGGAFDKLNYGAVDAGGRLLLPINGEVLALLDPRTGRVTTRPLRARVHQAGVALSRGRLLTVGAEVLDGARTPNLSIYDISSRKERLVPLARPHEDIAASSDGRYAYLSGGYTRGGWNGITVVPLGGGKPRELPLAGMPLGIAAIPR